MNIDLNYLIGERVRFYRTSHGISLENLGAAVTNPISGQMLARYETGQSRWPADLVVDISTELGVDIRLLTGLEDKKPLMESTEEWELEKYKHILFSMSDKARKIIYLIINGVKDL